MGIGDYIFLVTSNCENKNQNGPVPVNY